MIELGRIGVLAGKKVKAIQATEEGCKTCTFINVCARHSAVTYFNNAPKLHLDCMAKYRFDNISVYFLKIK